MNVGKWILGGVAGGVIGALIWAGITYATHREIGWIAWGVGGLVGLGVRLLAGKDDGFAPGITAGVIAVLAILAGKFLAVWLLFANLKLDGLDALPTSQHMISSLADDIARERMAKGKTVNWPAGVTLKTASEQKDYPPDIWQEASKRWAKLGAAEQQNRIAERHKEIQEELVKVKGALRSKAFTESFSPFDLLWFLLATITAFKLGSGLASGD